MADRRGRGCGRGGKRVAIEKQLVDGILCVPKINATDEHSTRNFFVFCFKIKTHASLFLHFQFFFSPSLSLPKLFPPPLPPK